jgi:hypothetical protein
MIFQSTSKANHSGSFSSPPRVLPRPQRAVIIPVGSGDGMDPGGMVWKGFLEPVRGRVDVYGLTTPWGIVPESTWLSWPGFLDFELDMTSRQASRDAADRVRAWMNSKGSTYRQILMVPSGSHMDVWSRGVRGSSTAERVRLLKVPRGKWGFGHPSVQRSMLGMVGL